MVHVEFVETDVCFAVQTCMAVKPKVKDAVYASSLHCLKYGLRGCFRAGKGL